MSTSASEKVVLTNDIRVGDTLYPAGTQEVPAEVADDLRRIDSTYNKHVMDRNKNNAVIRNAGVLSGGGN